VGPERLADDLDPDGDGIGWPDDCADRDPERATLVRGFSDTDGDGYGDPDSGAQHCGELPEGVVADDTDCDDSRADVHPGATAWFWAAGATDCGAPLVDCTDDRDFLVPDFASLAEAVSQACPGETIWVSEDQEGDDLTLPPGAEIRSLDPDAPVTVSGGWTVTEGSFSDITLAHSNGARCVDAAGATGTVSLSSVTLLDCVTVGHGAAVYLDSGTLSVDDVSVIDSSGNSAIAVHGGQATLQDLSIHGTLAPGDGDTALLSVIGASLDAAGVHVSGRGKTAVLVAETVDATVANLSVVFNTGNEGPLVNLREAWIDGHRWSIRTTGLATDAIGMRIDHGSADATLSSVEIAGWLETGLAVNRGLGLPEGGSATVDHLTVAGVALTGSTGIVATTDVTVTDVLVSDFTVAANGTSVGGDFKTWGTQNSGASEVLIEDPYILHDTCLDAPLWELHWSARGGETGAFALDDPWYDDTDIDMLPDGWERRHFGDIDAEDNFGDPDGDTVRNFAELGAGTSPSSADTDCEAPDDATDPDLCCATEPCCG